VLLRYGVWPRRRGETPFCRTCGYNLTGLVSERCPECGTALGPATIILGERRRRWVVIGAGSLALTAWLVVGFWAVPRVDWYALCPASLLMLDARSSDVRVADRACRELRWRIRKGTLSARQLSSLIEIGLSAQARAGPRLGIRVSSCLLDILGDCYLAGAMSGEQAVRFLGQLYIGELHVRPKVVKGDNVPLEIWIEGRLPPAWWLSSGGSCPILIDGEDCGKDLRWGLRVGTGGGGGDSFPCSQAGKHTVSVSVPVTCYAGPYGNCQAAKVIHQGQVPLAASFEVLETEPEGYVKLVRGAGLNARVQRCITPCDFVYGRT
jgi:hypothetical protein